MLSVALERDMAGELLTLIKVSAMRYTYVRKHRYLRKHCAGPVSCRTCSSVQTDYPRWALVGTVFICLT